MEKGFFHPDRGYWQTVGEPSEFILAAYPSGTVEVPLRPSPDYKWTDGAWVHSPLPPPTLEEIRAAMQPLTARQFRHALINSGRTLNQVDTAIAAITDDTQRAVTQVDWEYAAQLERLHPLILGLTRALNFTPEEVDRLWAEALQL